MKSFASDNYSGVHPKILDAIKRVNTGHAFSYGNDEITERVQKLFESIFGQVKVLFTFNGTGANVIALKCCTLPFEAVVCAESAHIHVDECGAPVQSIGCSLIPIHTPDGKLTPDLIQPYLKSIGNVHNNQPKVISISQSTELGTIYTIDELKSLAEFAHRNNMYLHLDGARISNAVASLGKSLCETTVDCGVDIMSFGGTKNGMLFGEAILIFNENLKKNAPFFHKQSAQLFSKNRFIAAQFEALLTDELWKKMAHHANTMAKMLAENLSDIPEVTITRPVQANAVFAIIPEFAIAPLQKQYPFYIWDDKTLELRWMCSFDTKSEDVTDFILTLQRIIDQAQT